MRCEFYALPKVERAKPVLWQLRRVDFFVFVRTRRLGAFGLDWATVEGMDVDSPAAYDSREGRAALLIAQIWRAASQAQAATERAAAAPAPAPAAGTYRPPRGQSVYTPDQRVRVDYRGRQRDASQRRPARKR